MENNNKLVWKLEELILVNKSEEEIQNIVRTTSKEEKLNFVDSLQEGKLSRLLQADEKYNIDIENGTIKTDATGYPKTVSLKSWIKRNKYEDIISDYVNGWLSTIGRTRNILKCERHISGLNSKTKYDTFETLIDELFYRQLLECKTKEEKYFREHDEYHVLNTKLEELYHEYNTSFGLDVEYGSKGFRLCTDEENARDFTIEEMKFLISKYEELQECIDKLTIDVKNMSIE